ncbi:D-amino acid dehydrogenase [Ferrovibrio sp.]|uniref:D-amino acid dehydrogenase n=1 Tax=Ferrovibrio sp. TaxID=1917215 RepID=UPI001B483DC2|nr:D-amino acid dehydrogenase [Ferrovibrio sp.]MBP7063684.1 D-amino acid dehydrogenase [Ferrovibrio sp.]
MKILVLGSGVIGTTSAYYLARAGHEVTVLDRQAGPALETSFANAGEVSPGYSAPWASPGLLWKAVKWLAMTYRPLVLRHRISPEMIRWGLQLLANCSDRRYALNKGRMLRLAEYSRDCLGELRQTTGLHYDQRMQGTLQLFRKQQQLDGAAADMKVLDDFGVGFELLDRAGCIAAEPALAGVAEKFLGGLRLPGDETGDCFKFTNALAEQARALGVDFRFNSRIEAILRDGSRIGGVLVNGEMHYADAYLLALGSYSPILAAPLGLRLPVYPVKGYSITLPIVDVAGAPESTVMDETYKVAVTRLGDRIRVGGTAELGGYDLTLYPARRRPLDFVVSDLFPRGGDLARATYWTGLRPMTPDGTPIIGATPYANLFLNTGHGTLGWTMAAGSGQVLADIISGHSPAIDTSDLGLARY